MKPGFTVTLRDESIEAGKGKTYSDAKTMQDPMAGLLMPSQLQAGSEDEEE